MFKNIKGDTTNEVGIKFSNFTSFLCDKICKDDPEIIIHMKSFPKERSRPDANRIRSIDIQAPMVLNKIEQGVPKISK